MILIPHKVALSFYYFVVWCEMMKDWREVDDTLSWIPGLDWNESGTRILVNCLIGFFSSA